jgi:hypothetical protein
MPAKKNLFCVEISDILEPEQEENVIEKIISYVKEDRDDLKNYFEKTDTIEIKRISEEEANKLADSLQGMDLSIRIYNIIEKKEKKETTQIKCPKCRYVLDYPDWRCPECFYEFPDYEFIEEETDTESLK